MFYRFYKAHPIRYRLIQVFVFLTLLTAYIIWGNWSISTSEYAVSSPDTPAAFAGFRLVQISDLHNAEFGEGNQRLLEKVAEARPDVILITGDMIDSRRTDIEVALTFAAGAMEIAPTYYVTGNHENRIPEYPQFRAGLTKLGVRVLEDEAITLERSGASISLIGLNDPSFGSFEENLTALSSTAQGYQILLAHRPELIEDYAAAQVDLVFSGHAHGGQFRIPFWGGVMGFVAPGQGFFPKYTNGLHTVENTQMIVSRGLGNSLFPFRLNNRPEVVVAELDPS